MNKMFTCEDGTTFAINQVVKVSVDDNCPSKKDGYIEVVDDDQLMEICKKEFRWWNEYEGRRRQKLEALRSKHKVLYWIVSLWDVFFGETRPYYCSDLDSLIIHAKIYSGGMLFLKTHGSFLYKGRRKWRVVTKHNAMTISNADYEKLKGKLDRLQISEHY